MEIKSILNSKQTWKNILGDESFKEELLKNVLPPYMRKCRWFAGKSSSIKEVEIEENLAVEASGQLWYLLLLEVLFEEGFVQQYFLPLGFENKEQGIPPEERAILAQLSVKEQNGWLLDALYMADFREYLFRQLLHERSVKFKQGKLTFDRGTLLAKALKHDITITSEVLRAEQSNTSIIYNDKFFLKIFRRLFRDTNPDLEMVHFLSEQTGFKNTPQYAGSLTWRKNSMIEISLGLMQEKIDNQGDAWNWLLSHIQQYYQNISDKEVKIASIEDIPMFRPRRIKKLQPETVALVGDGVLRGIKKLAKRTAQMHIKLSSDFVSTKFNRVTFNGDFTVWLKNRLIHQFNSRYNLVEKNMNKLTGLSAEYAREFMRHKPQIVNYILSFNETAFMSRRIRIHGDYHLGQVLVRDNDFFILDFEGEPESTIRDRKVKQTPLKDVAGIFRSFHYAVYATIFNEQQHWSQQREALFEAGEKYYRILVSVFINEYLKQAFKHQLDIGYMPEIIYLLKYNLIEKAIYELGYELQARPTWAIIPLQGIMQLMKS